MDKNILIISLEGIESNTEVNFFKGLNHWLRKTNIEVRAIGKISNASQKINNFREIIKMAINKNSEVLKYNVFFIGDHDIKSDISSMERARDVFKEVWEYLDGNLNLIQSNIIYPGKDKGFDQIILEISGKEISNIKRSDNRGLFNTFAKRADWIINQDELNKEKIKKDLTKLKTNYIQIYNFIVE